ncbi:MAG TPA: preprotein translocase subunit SecE [Actinomycetota bacterium]|nr:preprotein translocase subunit SecE [Actinomycetota bacterium]
MNRQAKRMLQRQQATQDRVAAGRRPVPERKRRVGPRQFLREVRQELKKVAWPTRREMVAYTTVVLVTVIVLTSLVFGFDFVISRAVLFVCGGQAG